MASFPVFWFRIVLMFALLGCSAEKAAVQPAQRPTPLPNTVPSPPLAPLKQPPSAPLVAALEKDAGVRATAVARLDEPTDPALRQAMNVFVSALYDKDTQRFLTLFSQQRPWRFVESFGAPRQGERVEYSRLARELATKSQDVGLYSALFDAGPDDCFREYVESDKGAPWTWVGHNRFVPPGEDRASLIYVVWRKEGGRWVVDTIGAPSA